VAPGKYFIRVPFTIGSWTLRSAMLGGRDLADVPLEIDDNDVGGVVLTFTDRPAEISGTVRNAQGQLEPHASVVIFPPDASSWVDFGSAPRRLRTERAGADGRFALSGLPAGTYSVAAVRGDVAGDWQSPAFLQELSRSAIKVTVGDAEKKTQDVVIK
jgi:hypothetical protein